MSKKNSSSVDVKKKPAKKPAKAEEVLSEGKEPTAQKNKLSNNEVNDKSDDKTAPESAPPGRPNLGPTDVLAHVVGLMLQSPAHKHLFLADLEWLVMPPLMLRQSRLFRKDGAPVGYATWAYLSDEAEDRFKNGARRMRPDDWKSGENLWLIDLVAPFGGGEAMTKDLKEKVFEGKSIKTLQPAPDGEGIAVVEW